MKKLFLFAVTAAFALSSCSENEEVYSKTESTGEIGFRTFTDKSTRTTITNGDNITSFTLSGFSALSQNLFNAFDITRRESDDWNYSPVRYWPGDDVNFYAYSPASSRYVTTGLTDLYNVALADRKISYMIPVVNQSTSQEDLLVAKLENVSSGIVKLNFQHALSRVLFQARTTSTHVNYIISGVELTGLYSEGDLSYTNIPETGTFNYPAAPTVLWDISSSTKSDIRVDISEAPIYLSTTYASILGTTDALMVLPQETKAPDDPKSPQADEFVIKVSYFAFVEDIDYAGNWKEYEASGGVLTPAVAYFPVKDPNRAAQTSLPFEIGRQYTFRMTFGAEVGEPIAFEVGVADWNNASTNPILLPNYATAEYFPDADFRAYLVSEAATFDTNKDNMLSAAELLGITSIQLPDGVADLTGIELLPNLTKIGFAPGYSGTTFPTVPAQNTIVTEVLLENATSMTDITGIEDFPNLTSLVFDSDITTMPAMSGITTLTLTSNFPKANLATKDISGLLPNVETVNFGAHNVNLSNLAKLKYLGVSADGFKIVVRSGTTLADLKDAQNELDTDPAGTYYFSTTISGNADPLGLVYDDSVDGNQIAKILYYGYLIYQ